jgi:hypothetical protein
MLQHVPVIYSFHGWIIFHCVDILHPVYTFTSWWVFLLPLLAIRDNTAVNMHVQVSSNEDFTASKAVHGLPPAWLSRFSWDSHPPLLSELQPSLGPTNSSCYLPIQAPSICCSTWLHCLPHLLTLCSTCMSFPFRESLPLGSPLSLPLHSLPFLLFFLR